MWADCLRRLHLAVQSSDTLFFMMRPMAAQDPSPAPLRLGIRPKARGIEIEFAKRRSAAWRAAVLADTSRAGARVQAAAPANSGSVASGGFRGQNRFRNLSFNY